MCAQFQIFINPKTFEKIYGVPAIRDVAEIHETVLPYHQAPVVLNKKGKRLLSPMNFSLIPSWSKEPKARFATHNARIESFDTEKKKTVWIYEKPTWRTAFARRHCLIPMTAFIEPIYKGDLAGNMVAFKPEDAEILSAAGIWEQWVNQKTGEIIESFSVITDDPIPFVKKIGHDRSPLFLKAGAFDEWLEESEKDPKDLVNFLRKNRADYEWEASKDRAMKPGWEKRA